MIRHMMLRKRSFLYLIMTFIGLIGQLSAQSFSNPCARILVGGGQDSVTWVAQPCANFGGYVIYATADINIIKSVVRKKML